MKLEENRSLHVKGEEVVCVTIGALLILVSLTVAALSTSRVIDGIAALTLLGGFLLFIGALIALLFTLLKSAWMKNRLSVIHYIPGVSQRPTWRFFKVLYIIGACVVILISVGDSLSYNCYLDCNEGARIIMLLFLDIIIASSLVGMYFVIRRLTIYILYGV